MIKYLNMNTYLLSDVCEKTKTKPGKLQAWMGEKWITPSVQKATGSGTRNIFNDGDIFAIQMLKVMIELGIPRKFAGEVAREFQKNKIYKKLTDGETKSADETSDMAFVEIYVTSDGKIEHRALIFNEAELLQARKKTNAAIIYGINLKLIIGRAAKISEGIKISESSIVKLSSGK
jgi:hypothetical protein